MLLDVLVDWCGPPQSLRLFHFWSCYFESFYAHLRHLISGYFFFPGPWTLLISDRCVRMGMNTALIGCALVFIRIIECLREPKNDKWWPVHRVVWGQNMYLCSCIPSWTQTVNYWVIVPLFIECAALKSWHTFMHVAMMWNSSVCVTVFNSFIFLKIGTTIGSCQSSVTLPLLCLPEDLGQTYDGGFFHRSVHLSPQRWLCPPMLPYPSDSQCLFPI